MAFLLVGERNLETLGKSMSKSTRKRDGKRKEAEAEASTAKQARVAEEDAASQAALLGRGQRNGARSLK